MVGLVGAVDFTEDAEVAEEALREEDDPCSPSTAVNARHRIKAHHGLDTMLLCLLGLLGGVNVI